jgi:hypothetical protein
VAVIDEMEQIRTRSVVVPQQEEIQNGHFPLGCCCCVLDVHPFAYPWSSRIGSGQIQEKNVVKTELEAYHITKPMRFERTSRNSCVHK